MIHRSSVVRFQEGGLVNSKSYFDTVAEQWDTMREMFFPESVRETALAVAGVKSGRWAADIGAGTGFITEALLKAGVQVIAVDQSEAMLAEIQRKFAAEGIIDCRVGDAQALPIPDQRVDYVFANMCLHHVESPPRAIAEMARILKPGGKLVITDLDEHDYEFLRREQHDRWMGFKREDIRTWFVEAGLKKVVVDCVGEECCAQSGCGCQTAHVSIFVASGVK